MCTMGMKKEEEDLYNLIVGEKCNQIRGEKVAKVIDQSKSSEKLAFRKIETVRE